MELTDSGLDAWTQVSGALTETAAICSPDDHTSLDLIAGLSAYDDALRTRAGASRTLS